MALCILAGSLAKLSTKPTDEWKKCRKMYAIKQIKICAEYRDMLPRPRLDLSGTPGLRPIGLSPGSWQTSLGLGSMSRYSAHILICITQGLYLTYNCVPQYIWGYFAEMCNKSHWILQRIYRLKVCNRRAFALSRRCRVSRSRPRVSGETITVISLWRHKSGPWDNGESIAAHSNATPRAMSSITI